MLNREALANGSFLRALKDTPGVHWWTPEQIEQSMRETLAQRMLDAPVWVFAYGSLIWNPLFHFVERRRALLPGWRRSFCMKLLGGRACTERPGRMMSLVPGERTEGLAFRLCDTMLEDELRIIWNREMVAGAYRPAWARVSLENGSEVGAIIFCANPESELHEPDDDIATVAPLIAAAHGPLGSNREYVLQLERALRELGIVDPYVNELLCRLDMPELSSR